MALITTTAFFLAVRLNALVVAILGMLGGFLTPILLSTGQDNPLGLFGYIAILDAGLIVVALNRRWYFLTALAAIRHGHHANRLGWKIFRRRKLFCRKQNLHRAGRSARLQRAFSRGAWFGPNAGSN